MRHQKRVWVFTAGMFMIFTALAFADFSVPLVAVHPYAEFHLTVEPGSLSAGMEGKESPKKLSSPVLQHLNYKAWRSVLTSA